jgi:hypothetical protein
MKKRSGTDRPKAVSESLMLMLTMDVISARKRWRQDDSQSTRRDLIRTMFAAIEGYVWEYRQNILQSAKAMDNLPITLEMALLEKSYAVSETGRVSDQPRFISLTAMFRLVTRVAERHSPALKIDFSNHGWDCLKAALKVRHRITHPKSVADLQILDKDIAAAEKGFLWLVEVIAEVVEISLATDESFLLSFEDLFAKLQAGDQAALELYNKAKAELDSDSDFGSDPQ